VLLIALFVFSLVEDDLMRQPEIGENVEINLVLIMNDYFTSRVQK